MPEAEHGFIYQMIGAGYTIDKAKAYVTGPLIDAKGNDTGVKLQIRSGGAAQHFDSPTHDHVQQRRHPPRLRLHRRGDPELGDKPSVAIESGFNKNPQMIMWDPAVYPDVTGIADLGKTERQRSATSAARAYMDFLTSTGVLEDEPGRRLVPG